MRKRRVLWPIFSFFILLAIMLTIVSFMVTKTNFVEYRVAELFKNIIESNFNVKVSIGETQGNILTGYTFYNIVLRAQDSIVVGEAKYVAVTFALQELLGKRKVVRRILIHEPAFDFTKFPPESLLVKKPQKSEDKTAGEAEKDTEQKEGGIAFKSISITKGNLRLLYHSRSYRIKSLSLDGNIYLSPQKNRIIIEKCSASLPGITNIKELSGSVIASDSALAIGCTCRTTESHLSISGTLFDEQEGVTLTIHALSLAEVSRLLMEGKGDLHGRISGSATVSGKGDDLVASASLAATNLAYGADSLGALHSAFRFERNRLTVTSATWELPDGTISFTGFYDMHAKHFDLKTEVRDLRLQKTISGILKRDLRGKLTGAIEAKGKNPLDLLAREMEVKAKLRSSSVKSFEFDSLTAHINYTKGSLTINRLDLESKGGKVHVEGVWGDEKDLRVETDNLMLAPILELAGITDINGVLRMKGRYTQVKGTHALQATIDCYEPHVKNIKAGHLSADINYNTSDNYSTVLLRNIDFLNTHLESLSVAVITDSIIRKFSLLADGEDIHLASLVNVDQEGKYLTLLIDTLNVKYKGAEMVTREQLKIEMRENDRFVLSNARVFLVNIPVLLDLEVDKEFQYTILMKSDSLDLRTIAELIEFNKDLGGALSLRVEGSGSLREPNIRLHLAIHNFFLEAMRADSISGEFEYSNDHITIRSLKILRGDEVSEVEGLIPVTVFKKKKDLSQRLELVVTANDLGAWIFYPFDRFAHFEGGKVYGTVRLTGTVSHVNMVGDLRIYSSNIYIPFLGIRMKETNGYLQLSEEEILINNVRANVEDGSLDVDGKINLSGITPQSIDLSISGEHLPITGFKDIYITVNPELRLSGPFSQLLLKGFVEIEKGDITIPFRRKLEKGIRKGGNFSYDIEIAADEGNIWLKNEDADVELAGNVFAKGTGNAPQLSGSFETKRGFIYYLDNTFTIERGIFRFMNSPELNPEIDLKAETKVRYTYMPPEGEKSRDTTAMVYLSVGGTMQQPQFSLTSSNPSFNEENIILLLSLNVTSLEDITSVENVSNLSDRAASFWIRQMLLREFQTTLGVDAIDLETRLIGSEKSAKLTVGKYVSKDLYLGATHDIFATSKDEFEIEYKVWKGSYLIGKRDEEGRYNLGVRFKFKY
jgi:hypothetical protein